MKSIIIGSLLLWTFSYTVSAELFTSNHENPDLELDTLQLIRKAGYPAEGHAVLTEDGYLLEMHRIPGKPGAPTIFVQHGVFGSSADWIVAAEHQKENSLAFLLSDAGYDVWLGNIRGNTYSRGHVSLSTKDLKYWDFSWHEVGVYDLPAMIKYIVNFTGSPLKSYVGYSMGTTIFYVMCSERPEITKLIQTSYSLAPIAFVKDMQGLLKYLAPLTNDSTLVSLALGKGELLWQNAFVKFLANYVCSVTRLEEKICANFVFTVVGFDNEQFDYMLLPVIFNHLPAGASIKTLIHYGQERESASFRQFDYGEKENMLKYNSLEPPSYNVSRIMAPHTLFVASNDWLSRSKDVDHFVSLFSVKPNIYKVPYKNFNHADYLFARNVSTLVYKPLLDMINQSK